MIKLATVLAICLALAACGQPAATAPQAQTGAEAGKPEAAPLDAAPQAAPADPVPQTTPVNAGKPEAAPAQAAPRAPAAAALTPAMLVGRWGDNGDCTKDIVINANGTFHSYTGGGGAWTLNGDILSLTGANGAGQVRVAVINGTTLLITNPDGSVGTSQRC